MAKFICRACGYVFSDENNEPDYAELNDTVPDDFVCPCCGKTECELAKEQA
jgi:rubredoxin